MPKSLSSTARAGLLDAGLRGQRFHETMDELRAASWLATSPLGYFVLDRESAAFFLRTKAPPSRG